MAKLFRTYNPGRDTRWPTAKRRPQPWVSLADLGPAQRQANEHALATTSALLPWKCWPVPMGEMHHGNVPQVYALLKSAPDLNAICRIDGRMYWCFRVPSWFMEELPNQTEIPGEPVKPLDLPADRRERLIEAIAAAGRRGDLADETLRCMAANVVFALRDHRPIGQALQLRLPEAELARVAGAIPAARELLTLFR